MKAKKVIVAIIFIIAVLLLLSSNVKATYQSIPTGSGVRATATTWVTGIRQMESSGQGMGLSETIDTTTGLATSTSNNIDVHMLKNTEYGAILLLGASDYGKQGSGSSRYMNSGATTTSGTDVKASSTGNVYGIYELGYYDMSTSKEYYEWTAGGGTSFLSNIAKRYRDIYSDSTGKPGDATTETKNWHGSSFAYFATGSSGFGRGNYGAFSYSSGGGASYNYYCRAGVVVGAGL